MFDFIIQDKGFTNELLDVVKNNLNADVGMDNVKLDELEKKMALIENKINKLLKVNNEILEIQDKEIRELEKTLKKYDELEDTTKPAVEEKSELIRKYSLSVIERSPTIHKLCDDGYFLTGRNHKSKWHIIDIMKLKDKIPNLELKWKDLSAMVNVSEYTVEYLCYMIETGEFDKYFKEWEQMQNTITKKDILFVNNPEKRKELMGMG